MHKIKLHELAGYDPRHECYLLQRPISDTEYEVIGTARHLHTRGGAQDCAEYLLATDDSGNPLDVTNVTVIPISLADRDVALAQLTSKRLDYGVVVPVNPAMEVDPGWTELNDGTVFGSIYSATGWPTWSETWYLKTGVVSLEGFSGSVYAKPSTYSQPGGLVQWNHAVSALTGTYESEADASGWLVVNSGGSDVAVIHHLKTGTQTYKQTWWLSSSFAWWHSASVIGAVITAQSASFAKNIRDGFGTNTRYKHVITKA